MASVFYDPEVEWYTGPGLVAGGVMWYLGSKFISAGRLASDRKELLESTPITDISEVSEVLKVAEEEGYRDTFIEVQGSVVCEKPIPTRQEFEKGLKPSAVIVVEYVTRVWKEQLTTTQIQQLRKRDPASMAAHHRTHMRVMSQMLHSTQRQRPVHQHGRNVPQFTMPATRVSAPFRPPITTTETVTVPVWVNRHDTVTAARAHPKKPFKIVPQDEEEHTNWAKVMNHEISSEIIVDPKSILSGKSQLLLQRGDSVLVTDPAEIEQCERLPFEQKLDPEKQKDVQYFKREDYLPVGHYVLAMGWCRRQDDGAIVLFRKPSTDRFFLISVRPQDQIVNLLSDRMSWRWATGVCLSALGVATIVWDVVQGWRTLKANALGR